MIEGDKAQPKGKSGISAGKHSRATKPAIQPQGPVAKKRGSPPKESGRLKPNLAGASAIGQKLAAVSESEDYQRGRRRALWVLVSLAALGFAVFIFFSPIRQLMSQENRLGDVKKKSAQLSKDNSALSNRVEELNDPKEIERLAREDLGLVRAGEEVYVILPPSEAGAPKVPSTKPSPAPSSPAKVGKPGGR